MAITGAATAIIQGQFRAPAAATVRFNQVNGGGPITSDLTLTLGDTYTLETLVTALDAQLKADWGGSAAFTVELQTDGSKLVNVFTDTGDDYDVTFSHTGDGTAFRDWLGESGDLVAQGHDSTWSSAVTGYIVPTYGFRRAIASRARRPRSHMIRLDATSQTQHSRDTGDADERILTVDVLMGSAAAWYLELEQFKTAFDEIFSAHGGRVTVTWDTTTWVGHVRQEDFQLRPRRVEPGFDELWTADFEIEVVG